MSWPLWMICLAAGTATTAVLLVAGWAGRAMATADVDARWPWWVRASYRPAASMAPGFRALIGEAVRLRTQRRLEAADLYPGISPEHWFAMRALHGAAAAAAAFGAARLADLPAALPALGCGLCAGLAAGWWMRRKLAEAERRIVRDLPSYLDLLTICVESGATLTAGIRLIVQQAPEGPLRSYFDRVLREVRSGRLRAQAFVSVASSLGVESLEALATALAHAESSGMSLGQVLRSQSEQRNAERFVRAERLAMLAPVKMLGPLILCIFPCTFIVLAVPIVHRLTEDIPR
jgi:tight adherence protein C